MNVKEKYMIDGKGRKIGVFIDAQNYDKLLHYIEFMEDSLELKHAIKHEREKGRLNS